MAEATKTRCFNIVGHAGCGKTSLAEALLFYAKATTRQGRVEEGNTASDFTPEEIERKISISSGILNYQWQGYTCYLVDVPGYADFVGEAISSLRAVDGSIVIVDASGGVEVGTERVWRLIEKEGLPAMIFVNKLDRENTDFEKVVTDIREKLGKKCAPIHFPVGKEHDFKGTVNILNPDELSQLSGDDRTKAESMGEALVESVAESSDALLEKFLEQGELGLDEVREGLRTGVIARSVVPILCGSATHAIGIEQLLDAIVNFFPTTQERPPLKASEVNGTEEVMVKPGEKGSFLAQVFKTISDPYVGQLTIFKVFDGTLKSDTGFFNVTTSAKERIGQILVLQGKEQRQASSVSAGEIAAVAKLKETNSGDTIASDDRKILLARPVFPEPAISASVTPKARGDEEKISTSLQKLAIEDPTFRVSRDRQTNELLISGVGDLHLEIMVQRLKQRFGVEVELGTPKVAYKETITKKIQVQYRHKKQSGGRGQYGEVYLELEPLERGGDFEFVDKIVGGAIPRNYIPAVEKGVKNAMMEGVVSGNPIVDIRVTLFDGSFHTVDSSDMAFQIAGSMALRKGTLEAGPVLLEPIMDVEIMVPEDYMGSITGDVNSRRGRIMGMDASGTMQIVKAQIPLAEILKYATDLRSMTQGRGSYAMRFSHYEIVPQRIAQGIIAQVKAAKEES
ncbi:MAG: elongation factor G [Candidatus Omnitrophica bacterium]|nr:elongation factor G [Candidatus Omnitrophota bacterium]